MRKLRNVVVVTSVAVLLLAGCQEDLPSGERGRADSPRKVLIAGEDTPFKRTVIDNVVEELGTEEWYFRIIGLDDLRDTDTHPFGAILLAARYSGGRIDKRATSFLRGLRDREKAILLYTAGAEGPLPDAAKRELRGIDAVGSASRQARARTRADELVELIRSRF